MMFACYFPFLRVCLGGLSCMKSGMTPADTQPAKVVVQLMQNVSHMSYELHTAMRRGTATSPVYGLVDRF